MHLFRSILVLGFSFFVFGFMFNTLSYKPDTFEKSLLPCCNNGQCTYTYSSHDGTLCSTSSSIEYKTNNPKSPCQTYLLTCRDCVDGAAAGQVCGDPQVSCKTSSGDCYGWCYDPNYGGYRWIVQ